MAGCLHAEQDPLPLPFKSVHSRADGPVARGTLFQPDPRDTVHGQPGHQDPRLDGGQDKGHLAFPTSWCSSHICKFKPLPFHYLVCNSLNVQQCNRIFLFWRKEQTLMQEKLPCFESLCITSLSNDPRQYFSHWSKNLRHAFVRLNEIFWVNDYYTRNQSFNCLSCNLMV